MCYQPRISISAGSLVCYQPHVPTAKCQRGVAYREKMFSMDYDLGPVHDQMAPVLREACHSGMEWLRRAGSEEQEEETRREPIIPLADGFPKIKGLVSLPYSPLPPRKTLLPQGHGTSHSTRVGEQACTLGRFLGGPLSQP